MAKYCEPKNTANTNVFTDKTTAKFVLKNFMNCLQPKTEPLSTFLRPYGMI